jgi:hypothetical protein
MKKSKIILAISITTMIVFTQCQPKESQQKENPAPVVEDRRAEDNFEPCFYIRTAKSTYSRSSIARI